MRKNLFLNLFLLGSMAAFLTSCANMPEAEEDEIVTKRERKYQGYGKFFGEDTLLFGGDNSAKKPDVGIGVNSYLWKASLDTLSFMPLKSVDPFGGVISTEWYVPKDSPNERVKVDVRILDRVLRADGLSISIFRQEYQKGRWVNAGVNPATKREIEDAILTRARQLKVASS
ncbi:MAG TPA: DUF3576 domain-containing protein [Holosporales bacterium]|nr:DUF3576 domain-containing protein [Holosporales bacterium]